MGARSSKPAAADVVLGEELVTDLSVGSFYRARISGEAITVLVRCNSFSSVLYPHVCSSLPARHPQKWKDSVANGRQFAERVRSCLKHANILSLLDSTADDSLLLFEPVESTFGLYLDTVFHPFTLRQLALVMHGLSSGLLHARMATQPVAVVPITKDTVVVTTSVDKGTVFKLLPTQTVSKESLSKGAVAS